MPTERMRVSKYIPDKLYGFAIDESGFEVFFHLGVFRPGEGSAQVPAGCCSCNLPCEARILPPPIIGEPVTVTYEQGDAGRAPRASRVDRITPVEVRTGRVESLDPQRGFGFIKGDDGESYYLHRSEIADGHLPLSGQQVVFCAGIRQGRPRACHVRMCRWRRQSPAASCSEEGPE